MKKIGKMKSVAALSLSAIIGLGSVAVLAQSATTDGTTEQTSVQRERRGGGKGKTGKMRRGGKRGGGMMFAKLNLSEDQKAQMKQLRESSREATKPLRDELRAKRQELRQANAGGGFNEALTAQKLTEMASLQAKLMGESVKQRQAMMAILTPEQKAQLEAAQTERRAKREERKAKRAERKAAQTN